VVCESRTVTAGVLAKGRSANEVERNTTSLRRDGACDMDRLPCELSRGAAS